MVWRPAGAWLIILSTPHPGRLYEAQASSSHPEFRARSRDQARPSAARRRSAGAGAGEASVTGSHPGDKAPFDVDEIRTSGLMTSKGRERLSRAPSCSAAGGDFFDLSQVIQIVPRIEPDEMADRLLAALRVHPVILESSRIDATQQP